jgi:hypothetical protein
MSDKKVQGFCPMGCGETLFLGSGGYVTCGYIDCPNPTALADILAIRETEHIVELEAKTFSVQHPLRERLNGELFACDLHRRISALDGPPATPGKYRVLVGERLHWQALSSGVVR